ncbi:hypothetical protein Pint_21005 [Pistacia integerrima]|uniref:Uncharacterized protein n=1 Tax=Pistacia integerrima TaxID=434235 RepID=A0ACC0XD06_9ROSI|nr:hypothetical protein Pint_21005 [Pistacia integerrima]
MHGIGRLNGVFYPGRRRNYQTSSIPSRQGNDPSTYCRFFMRHKRANLSWKRKNYWGNCAKPLQGFMYKEQASPYGLYPKTWKGMFLCQQQKPKLMELLIL